MNRHLAIFFLCFIGLTSATHADLRNKPYQAPLPPIEFDAFVLSVALTTTYQWVTGELVEGSGPVEAPEDPVTDLQDDLALEPDIALGVSVEASHKSRWWPDLRFDYTPIEFTGKHQLEKNLRVGNMSFLKGQVVRSQLEAISLDLTLLYRPIKVGSTERPSFLMALGLTARNVQAALNVRSAGVWRVGAQRYDVPVLPMAFLSIDGFVSNRVGLHVEARGIGDGESHWLDAQGAVRVYTAKRAAWLAFGHRFQHLKVVQAGEGGLDAQVRSGDLAVGIRF